jgi:hypothetical protein
MRVRTRRSLPSSRRAKILRPDTRGSPEKAMNLSISGSAARRRRTRCMNVGYRSTISLGNTAVAHKGSSPTMDRTRRRVEVPSGSRSTS